MVSPESSFKKESDDDKFLEPLPVKKFKTERTERTERP
jgi:hypothetical protein